MTERAWAIGCLSFAEILLFLVMARFGPERWREWRAERTANRKARNRECIHCWRPAQDNDTLCWLHGWEHRS